MIFYDFEVTKFNYLVVFIDSITQEYTLINDDQNSLKEFYEQHKNDLYCAYNGKHYDQFIYRSILLSLNPYDVSRYIIEYEQSGWSYPMFKNSKDGFYINQVDVAEITDGGLKFLESQMGEDIEESEIDFNINRPLTVDEINKLFKYCIHDVEQAMLVAHERFAKIESNLALIKKFNMPLKYIGCTGAQITERILKAKEQQQMMEQFNIRIPNTIELKKYKYVAEWYLDKNNHDYDKSLITTISNVPCVFAWGGLHGAIQKYIENGLYFMIDVNSMYPSIMREYDLLSRTVTGENRNKFYQMIDDRLVYKKAKNKVMANAYKLIINSCYGAMKQMTNKLYDPLNANLICIFGQLFILDLCEHLEGLCKLIQINTDGILIKITDESCIINIKDEIRKWERRTRLTMEIEEYTRIIQKDVNNYIAVKSDKSYKCKGAYVKELSKLDNNDGVINEAIKEFFINDVKPIDFVNNCTSLQSFQHTIKLTKNYKNMYHNNKKLNGRVFRVFASNDDNDGALFKCKANGKIEKCANTPQHCFIYNGNINDLRPSEENEILKKINRTYYYDIAYERIEEFGFTHNENGQIKLF